MRGCASATPTSKHGDPPEARDDPGADGNECSERSAGHRQGEPDGDEQHSSRDEGESGDQLCHRRRDYCGADSTSGIRVVDGQAESRDWLTIDAPSSTVTAGPREPVLYVELSPEEEALVLATLDPIGALATPMRPGGPRS